MDGDAMNRDDSKAKAYDVRTLERNLRRGLISRKEYEKYLQSLPDRAENATAYRPEEGRPEPDERNGESASG
jgi:hypothetical protein